MSEANSSPERQGLTPRQARHVRIALSAVIMIAVGVTLVHVGFALQRLDEESAKQTLELFATLGMLQEEFGDPWELAAQAGGSPLPAAGTETPQEAQK